MAEQFIQRGRHQSGFAVLSNKIWEDEKLSVEAKGTLGYLLSRPANWRVRMAQVAKKLAIGRDRLYRIINECIEAGYIERRQARSAGAFKPVTYYVRDVASLPHTDLPEAAEPEAAEPDTANQDALIKKKVTKEDSEQITSSPPAPPTRTLAREEQVRQFGEPIASEVLAGLPVSARAHPGWRGLGAWIDRLLADEVERVDIVVGITQCLRSLKDQPPSTFGYFTAAIERARQSRTAPLPQVSTPTTRSHQLGHIGDCLRKRLGNDVFAAWFGRSKIVSECGDTATLAVETKFIRSRILAEYQPACVEVYHAWKPSIVRVDVIVAEGAR